MLLWRRLRMDAAGEEGAGASRAPAVLDFGEMHATLDAFLRRFDRYVQDTVGASERERMGAETQRTEDEERIKALERQREELKQAQKDLWDTVASERDADAKLRAGVAALHAQRTSLAQRPAELQGEVGDLRAALRTRRRHKEEQEAHLAAQVRRNAPELAQLERLTGCRITPAVADGVVRVAFTLLCEAQPARECALSVDVSQEQYAVPEADPLLPDAQRRALVKQLNASGDFAAFLLGARRALQAALEGR